MAFVVIYEGLGMTQAMYERISRGLGNGKGPPRKTGEWPVPGLISHVAGPTSDGLIVVDVWESEEAVRHFGEILYPLVREAGAALMEPKVYPVFNVVT